MEPTNGSFVPASPDLVWVVFIQQVLVLTAWLIDVVVRRILKNRMTMSTVSAILTGLAGLWGDLMIAGWIFDSGDLWKPGMIGVAAPVALIVIIVVSLITAYLHPCPDPDPISEVAKRDEPGFLEFKSSAHWNMRTGKRGDAMETVIAKTVVASMNSGDGTLLIGVDGDGQFIDMGPDYLTLKTPDSDHSELQIRNMWGQRVGTSTAVLPRLDFTEASDPQEGYEHQEVYRVAIPPLPHPVYLRGPKGKGEAKLWMRVDNLTQYLGVTGAVQYVSTRWPKSMRASP